MRGIERINFKGGQKWICAFLKTRINPKVARFDRSSRVGQRNRSDHPYTESRDCSSRNKGTSGCGERVARQIFAEAQTAWFSIDDAGLPASSPKLRRPLGRVSAARDARQQSSPLRERRLHYSPIVSQIVSREDHRRRCGITGSEENLRAAAVSRRSRYQRDLESRSFSIASPADALLSQNLYNIFYVVFCKIY